MDYQLARSLKDAGFKQGDGEYVYKEDHCWLDEEYQGTDGYEAYCYMPELSELIEACKTLMHEHDSLFVVEDRYRGVYSKGTWIAGESQYIIEAWQDDGTVRKLWLSNPPIGAGSTPEEAVSRLWLALNKKT